MFQKLEKRAWVQTVQSMKTLAVWLYSCSCCYTLARVVIFMSSARRTDNISSTLKLLHWLPVDRRVKFKIVILAQKTLQNVRI